MKKQSGFTLIELVIVIIILGVLAATAVPKFVDMKDDAHRASMKGLKGTIESAASLIYSKAVIDGREMYSSDKNTEDNYNIDGVNIAYGYPRATVDDLIKVAGLSDKDWTLTPLPFAKMVKIVSKGKKSGSCEIHYYEGTSTKPFKIELKECDGGKVRVTK